MRRGPSGALILALAIGGAGLSLAQVPPPPTENDDSQRDPPLTVQSLINELRNAAVRLPLAAVLGTALALRPRRRGDARRRPSVVETQIVLAVVGAVVMLVVGASLARAFGIVGVASLIRYRTKIDDPTDAVVMFAALSVGLASGVGLFSLAIFSTLFLAMVLWIVESFEPRTRIFELSVKLGDKTAELRPRIEAVLRRYKAEFEVRAVSEAEVAYIVTAPSGIRTDSASRALTEIEPDGKGGVEWKEITRKESK